MKVFLRVYHNFIAMPFKAHLRYWLAPLLATVAMMLCYYAGNGFTQEIVAPGINREFGLVENCQNLLILLIVCISFFQALKSKGIVRHFHIGAVLLFCFLFAEETDYFLHWIEYLNDTPDENRAQIRNIHNQGEMLQYMLIVAHLILAAVALLPYFYKGKNKLVKQLMPSDKSIFTVIILIIISRLAYIFVSNDFMGNGSLAGNRAEFEEGVLYYIFCIYFLDLRQQTKDHEK